MESLNFLRLRPLTNWFDYFLNRTLLADLLSTASTTPSTTTRESVAQLLDQFIEQALLAERDVSLLEKKGPLADVEDLANLRVKCDELWLCAASCSSALGWALDTIHNASNVIRVRALLNKLLHWAYWKPPPAPTDDAMEEMEAQPPTFQSLCGERDQLKQGGERLFVVWLYAKWVVMVERVMGRFPTPPAKPTVSNPQALLDQSLLLAERVNLAVGEVRIFK